MKTNLNIPYGNSHINAVYRAGDPLVVFSHGFGTEKTSGGLFKDIAESLPNNYGYVMFDYYTIKDGHWYVPPMSTMVSMHKDTVAFAKSKSNNVLVIAHSQGCSITALASLNEQTIFLAPPTHTITNHFKELFVSSRKARASIDENGDVHLKRKRDDQELQISSAWFDEIVELNSFAGMKLLAKSNKLTIIEALQDEDIKDRRRYPQLEKAGAKKIAIPGNHNFDPPHRTILISAILDLM